METVRFNPIKSHQRYLLADGTEVPGVTTVLGRINKPALLDWACKCGQRGEDWRKVRDAAAESGTLAHWLIECHLRGVKPDLSEFSPAKIAAAENAMVKFLTWWDAGGFVVLLSEVQLVSELHCYGGTLDIVARDATGRVAIVDIKTSSGVYDEHWLQLAAYAELWDEHCPILPLSRYIICRVGRTEEACDFEACEMADLSGAWSTFAAALLYFRREKAWKRGQRKT